ncbi:rod-binding protein [Roseicitreum antarcticum]|uniref:Rod binding protein n=1 Tax=Roseicitreum antarcticum TaxID=564137 RepID=A0A1H2XAQ1_9RHOB|nr:rod-binding protein [Roseicitreum antarcticum]SDW89891.1 Rod binding protein [Roseicitreum antarcticum]
MTPNAIPSAVPLAAAQSPRSHDAVRRVAEEFETAFLTEMLKASGLGKPLEGFGGGGTGEAQFSSFMVEGYAEAIRKSGGLGLSETIFRALVREEADGSR